MARFTGAEMTALSAAGGASAVAVFGYTRGEDAQVTQQEALEVTGLMAQGVENVGVGERVSSSVVDCIDAVTNPNVVGCLTDLANTAQANEKLSMTIASFAGASALLGFAYVGASQLVRSFRSSRRAQAAIQ